MDTRRLGYLGIGSLVAIVGVTLIGVPPEFWIAVAIAAVVVGTALVVRKAQADGTDIAGRIMALTASETTTRSPRPQPASTTNARFSAELVRAADEASGVPAVWLHRRGGRRVHRFATDRGWVVQQVSTKDPDNPRKRVIGETLTFAREAEAVDAAEALARGIRPTSTDRPSMERSVLAA